jgi:hypothetical protein
VAYVIFVTRKKHNQVFVARCRGIFRFSRVLHYIVPETRDKDRKIKLERPVFAWHTGEKGQLHCIGPPTGLKAGTREHPPQFAPPITTGARTNCQQGVRTNYFPLGRFGYFAAKRLNRDGEGKAGQAVLCDPFTVKGYLHLRRAHHPG